MKAPADLTGLSYGLLALGDRTYADFCGFGRAQRPRVSASSTVAGAEARG